MSKVNWAQVAATLVDFSNNPPHNGKNEPLLDESQRASLAELAKRIRDGKRMTLIADEVGMGKTRIAAALIAAVRAAGGRAVVVLPPGLGVQWQTEIQLFSGVEKPLLPLRSYEGFIAGFAKDEDRKTNKQKLMDRRAQRELPSESWSSERVLMISHGFATMRFPAKEHEAQSNEHWRRLLLEKVRIFCGGANLKRRIEKKSDVLNWMQIGTYRAAEFIALHLPLSKLEEIKAKTVNYYKGLSADNYKEELLPLIGVALGLFDLVVIDEAHKYRGENSSLTKILEKMLHVHDDTFRLGMTATPVELNSEQWINTIERINGSDGLKIDSLKAPINDYIDAVKRVQTEVLDDFLVADFECKAANFKNALGPYVLRRDKRDDPNFAEYIENYRNVEACLVKPKADGTGISREWLRRMAAAEALSLSTDVSPQERRMRIQLAQGLGLIGHGAEVADDHFEKSSQQHVGVEFAQQQGNISSQFWIEAAMSSQAADIYSHPSILEAVRLVESYTKIGQKVLVFGVFINPLKALSQLLDAREMLRAVESGYDWPAGQVGKDVFNAVNAALKMQDASKIFLTAQDVDEALRTRSSARERERKRELDQLKIELSSKADSGINSADFLLRFWLSKTSYEINETSKNQTKNLFSALDDIRAQGPTKQWTVDELLVVFEKLVSELLMANVDDTDNFEEFNPSNISWTSVKFQNKLQLLLDTHLEDYSGQDGSFARLMQGDTKPQSRRNLQVAFNRPNSRLKVLLAQSQVGREGLNLQESCKTIVLLHSEWNPAVVEQQIGRVDRKNSLWLKDLAAWESKNKLGNMPTINIHPIVFAGTYGELHWKTLEGRWKSLRAQLHGEILPRSYHVVNADYAALMDRVKYATPRFSP